MNKKEAAKVLDNHNKWRRGGDGEMLHPADIGTAIDVAVSELSKKVTWPSLKFPPINLWSLPHPDVVSDTDAELEMIYDDVVDTSILLQSLRMDLLIAMEKKKERDFIYYTRSGRFPDDK